MGSATRRRPCGSFEAYNSIAQRSRSRRPIVLPGTKVLDIFTLPRIRLDALMNYTNPVTGFLEATRHSCHHRWDVSAIATFLSEDDIRPMAPVGGREQPAHVTSPTIRRRYLVHLYVRCIHCLLSPNIRKNNHEIPWIRCVPPGFSASRVPVSGLFHMAPSWASAG